MNFNKNVLKCRNGPVGPVEVIFYWPEAVFRYFYWPGAIGLLLASSPALHYCYKAMKIKSCQGFIKAPYPHLKGVSCAAEREGTAAEH